MMLRYIFVQWASRMYGICTLKAAICILKGAFMCTCFIRIRQITAIIVYSVRAGKHIGILNFPLEMPFKADVLENC